MNIETKAMDLDKKVKRAVIRRAIMDLTTYDTSVVERASQYFRTLGVHRDLALANYPEGILDTVKYMVISSKAQREFIAKELLKYLDENYTD